MTATARRFPLVADGEAIITPSKTMALYDNEDLITNIRGDYRDKDYDDVTRDYNFVSAASEQSPERVQTVNEGKSYAELAREQARRDIKKKRQAYYVPKEAKLPSRSSSQKAVQPNSPKTTEKTASDLNHISEKLHQDSYILAELPVNYKEPDNSGLPKQKKNNYDFLKRSQIYNKEGNQAQRERKIAQELNLTRFDHVENQ